MSLIDYSRQQTRSRRLVMVALIVCAGLAVTAAAVMTRGKWPLWKSSAKETRTFVTVRTIPLDLVIRQDGELQSVNNIDINCPVTGQNTIQNIVPEGSFVKKNDVIAVLDSTEHRRTLEGAEIELEKAEGDVKWSREQRALQETKNSADLASAKSELELATINVREYELGEFPASKRDMERKLEMANIKLNKMEEEYATARRLLEGKFLTLSEVKKAELDVVTAKNEQEKAASDLAVLIEYKNAKDSAERRNKLTLAQNKIAQVMDENASNLSQKTSDLRTKERQLELRKQFKERAQKNFDSCTIKAPADGMVLYASSVSMNYYREQPIQVGAKLFQEQMMVRLPDVSKMKAVAMVAESRVMKLRALGAKTIRADVTIVGITQTIGATLTKVGVLPDNSQRYVNPDAKNYPVDLTLDETPPNLKPGTTAKVVIYIDRLENVQAVPVGAIYASGEDHYVFTRALPNPKPAKVKLGESNETSVQILEGVTTGEEVLLLGAGEGRELLDLAGIKTREKVDKPASPTSRPAPAVAQPGDAPQPAPTVG